MKKTTAFVIVAVSMATAFSFAVAKEKPNILLLPADTGFTMTVSLDALPEQGDINLLSEPAADGGLPRWRLAVEGTNEARRLLFDMRNIIQPALVEFSKNYRILKPETKERIAQGLMGVAVPLQVIGAGSHTVDVRLSPPVWNLELFVDGVLVDRDWPLSPMVQGKSETVSCAALVKDARVRTDDPKIVAHNGGIEAVAARRAEFYGADNGLPPFFKPYGIGLNAGDCMPMFDGKRWHLFYLKGFLENGAARQTRWGAGTLYTGHISTGDLIHWDEHPDPIGLRFPYEGAIWTGSFFQAGDEVMGFYAPWMIASRLKDFDSSWGVRVARSKDGINFNLPEPDTFLKGVAGGDADVFKMEDGNYGMVSRGDQGGKRKMFFYTSPDLKIWTEQPCPFEFAPNNCDCPHYFTFGGISYFFAAETARKAPKLYGPWTDIPKSSLGVPKTAEWKNGRRLIAGTIGDDGWGGDAVLHELIQLSSGNLGEKFIDEITPVRGEQLDLKPLPIIGSARIDGRTVAINGGQGFSSAAIDRIPQMARIRMTIKPASGGKSFGLVLRGKGEYQAGTAVVFHPDSKTVAMGPVVKPGEHREKRQIHQVDSLDQSISLDIILGFSGLIDIEINNERCITSRGSKDVAFDRLFLFADGGEAVFENIEIRPWEPVATVNRYHGGE